MVPRVDPELPAQKNNEQTIRPGNNCPGNNIHRRSADESRHGLILGEPEDVFRPVNLDRPSFIHDRQAGRHGHGLHLVMGDINDGCRNLPVQAQDLRAHLHAQAGV